MYIKKKKKLTLYLYFFNRSAAISLQDLNK